MNLLDAAKLSKPFKRKDWNKWYHAPNSLREVTFFVIDDDMKYYLLTFSDLLADDYIIKEEKWYDGDFKKKYPNGVLCWVSNLSYSSDYVEIIKDYNSDEEKFISIINEEWNYAKPISKKDAPVFLEDLEETKND